MELAEVQQLMEDLYGAGDRRGDAGAGQRPLDDADGVDGGGAVGAQGAGDGAKMVELLDEKVRWTPPAAVGLGAPEGRDNVLQAMAEAGAKFFDLSTMKVDVKWMLAEGDKVVIRQHAAMKAALDPRGILNPGKFI